MKIAFDNEKYLKLQSENILKRMNMFGEKLYLEFGGKLFDDYHASRVLPGFLPNSKLKMLLTIKDKVEIIIVINANDIESNKMRNDIGINYEQEVLRLIDAFRESELYVGSVCVTRYHESKQVDSFIKKLNHLGVTTYKHYKIEGYPLDVENIISEKGFGKNEYIKTTRPVVVVTAPGPGSGKMATCLSQLYHENKRGVKAGYSKYETFPIWNLPLNHPVNLAYEAATIDLNDVNMIDPFHMEAYNKLTVNYNRDVEIFPVVKSILEAILGSCPYKSPTDMGVNMAGYAIVDDEAACEASKNEIIRRYLQARVDFKNAKITEAAVDKAKLLMTKAGVSVDDRKCVKAAFAKKAKSHEEAMAIELNDGRIITGKTSSLLLAPAAVCLNALKVLAGIPKSVLLIPREIIEPVGHLKTVVLGRENPKLHLNETLICLSIAAQTNENAKKALDMLPQLNGCQAHSTIIINENDINVYKKLKVNLTFEPEYYAQRLYHKA